MTNKARVRQLVREFKTLGVSSFIDRCKLAKICVKQCGLTASWKALGGAFHSLSKAQQQMCLKYFNFPFISCYCGKTGCGYTIVEKRAPIVPLPPIQVIDFLK